MLPMQTKTTRRAGINAARYKGRPRPRASQETDPALPFAPLGEIAQLVEHTTENRGVPGSNPGLAISPARADHLPAPGPDSPHRLARVDVYGPAIANADEEDRCLKPM